MGPTTSGIFVDAWGFQFTTLLLFLVYIFSIVIDSLELSYNMKKLVSYNPQECLTIERESKATEEVGHLVNN